MKLFLLPHSFKKIGTYLMPMGLLIWCLTQANLFNAFLTSNDSALIRPKVIVLSFSFFSFLFGLCFIVFAKEKTEDEYINMIRLKSFQLSSFVQLNFYVISFVLMFIFQKEPKGDAG